MKIICPFCKIEISPYYPIVELGDDTYVGMFNCPCDKFSYSEQLDETTIILETFQGYPEDLIKELMKFDDDTPEEIIQDWIEENKPRFNL